jgi:hypothetical protein
MRKSGLVLALLAVVVCAAPAAPQGFIDVAPRASVGVASALLKTPSDIAEVAQDGANDSAAVAPSYWMLALGVVALTLVGGRRRARRRI